MIEFPSSKLQPCSATLSMGNLNKPALKVHFKPFSVQEQFEREVISYEFDHPLRADFIELPTVNAVDLLDQVFDFPINQTDGCIDASVYFRDRHNPVAISRLEFGKDAEGQIVVIVVSRWLMTFERSAANDFDYTFTVAVQH